MKQFIHSENLYRKNAEECRDHAARARKLEDRDAWLSIAEDWLRLAVELNAAADRRTETSQQR